jgi:hypothetical protein
MDETYNKGDLVIVREDGNNGQEHSGIITNIDGYHYTVKISGREGKLQNSVFVARNGGYSIWKLVGKIGGSNRRRRITKRKLNKKKKSIRRKRH